MLDKVFDRQLDESTFHEILLHRVQRHAAPAQSFEKKGVLGKKIAQSPRERRHDAEFAPNRQLGSVGQHQLYVFGEFCFWNHARDQREGMLARGDHDHGEP